MYDVACRPRYQVRSVSKPWRSANATGGIGAGNSEMGDLGTVCGVPDHISTIVRRRRCEATVRTELIRSVFDACVSDIKSCNARPPRIEEHQRSWIRARERTVAHGAALDYVAPARMYILRY